MTGGQGVEQQGREGYCTERFGWEASRAAPATQNRHINPQVLRLQFYNNNNNNNNKSTK